MAYQKGKLNQEFLSVASLGNNQPTGIIQKATDGYAKNAYGKPIDNGGFLTELNLLGKSEQNKEEVNEYSISGYSEVVKSENLTSFEDKTETINGVTYTYNGNTITATGTATGNSNRNMSKIKLPAGTYKVFYKYEGTLPSEYVEFEVYNSSGYLSSVSLSATSPNQLTKIPFTLDTTDNIYLSFHYNLPSSEVNIKITYTIVQDSVTTPKFDVYFEPYIKNCGIKNIMKSVVYESTTVRPYAPLVAFNTNVHKGHKYYLQYEIFKEGLSGLYANRNVFKSGTPFPSEVGIHSYIFTSYMDLNNENNTIINQGHNFGFLTNISGGLQLEGNGVSDYIGNFILVDCTGIEAPKETLPSNLEYNKYYVEASDNTLINLGTEPLRQNDIANTNGEKVVNREVVDLNSLEWTKWADNGLIANLSVNAPNISNNDIPNAICNKYEVISRADVYNGNKVGISINDLNIYISNSLETTGTLEYQTLTETKQRNPQNAIRALPTGLSFTDYHKDNITNTMTTITTPTANFPEEINSLVNPIMDYTGRNLISLEDITTSNYSIKNGVIKFTGTSSYTIKFNKEIKLISGKKYILSRLNIPKLEDNTYGANFHIGYVDSSTNKYQMLFDIGYTKAYGIITPTEDTIVNALNTNGIRLPSVDCCPMLIETTEPPIKFEPYFNTNIKIPYTLRSINENNVSDYIKIEKDKVILVQCVGVKEFNGSEPNWKLTSNEFVLYNSGLSHQLVNNSAYSNWYKNQPTTGSWFLSRDHYFMITKNSYLLIRDNYFNSDLTLFKNYLKENPLTIQYILETPIETDITNTEFGNNILNFVRNDFKGGDSYFTLNDSNNNLVHLKYYSTDYQENGEPTTAEKDPITNRYTILIQPIIDNKGVSADVDWVKKEVIY